MEARRVQEAEEKKKIALDLRKGSGMHMHAHFHTHNGHVCNDISARMRLGLSEGLWQMLASTFSHSQRDMYVMTFLPTVVTFS